MGVGAWRSVRLGAGGSGAVTEEIKCLLLGGSPDVCGPWAHRHAMEYVAAELAAAASERHLREELRQAVDHLDCPNCFPVPFYEASVATMALSLQARGAKK